MNRQELHKRKIGKSNQRFLLMTTELRELRAKRIPGYWKVTLRKEQSGKAERWVSPENGSHHSSMCVCTFLSLMEQQHTGVVSLSQCSLPEDWVSVEETCSTTTFWSAAVFGSALRLPDNTALFLFPP